MRQRERLQGVIEDLSSHPNSPDRERLIRVCRAIFEEIKLLEARMIQQDPAEIAALSLRPLAQVEHEHILAAVRSTGSVHAAAELLQIAAATIYRRLQKSSDADLEGIHYRRGASESGASGHSPER